MTLTWWAVAGAISTGVVTGLLIFGLFEREWRKKS